MLDPSNVPPVDLQELLARYVFSRAHIGQGQRVKAAAFMPPSDLQLSVTRHRDATESQIWAVGNDVAAESQRSLHGRADALASTFVSQRLQAISDPIPTNPNHAHILGWPVDDKPAQKLIAEEIAAVAKFVAVSEP